MKPCFVDWMWAYTFRFSVNLTSRSIRNAKKEYKYHS